MKIIQTFWSGNKDPLKNNYGWSSIESHYLGWILSVNQLLSFYDEVELYTDMAGYEVLIKQLKLPYTKVHIVLDELNDFPDNFWAIAKVKVYSMQKEPFLHVDGDVFIWERFDEKLLRSNLIAQNLERTTEYYSSCWNLISPKLIFKPQELIEYELGSNYACNMGVFGGNKIEFLREYSERALNFVSENKLIWNEIKELNFNVFFEQVLFGQMVLNTNEDVSFLIKEEIYDNGYREFGDFDKVPNTISYLHLLGDFKRDPNTCKMMECYVLNYYPSYFKELVKILPQSYFNFPSEYDFTHEINNKWVDELKWKLENRLKIEEDKKFLISKDLLSLDLPKFFIEKTELNEDFLISRFLSNEILVADVENKYSYLATKDINNRVISFQIDEIDEMLLESIGFSIRYNTLIVDLFERLDETALDMKNEFVSLIKDKLYYFIKHKIIAVTS